ncbi:MAG TPA: hypothetical protein VGH16_09285 [Candidatus Binatia bacterium]|jgi:hypothetical protein
MKHTVALWVIVVVLLALNAFLLFNLRKLDAENAALKDAAPGLGDYMTTIQLHAGKLWFAAEAANWELAAYEIGELKETMESAEKLEEEKNGVRISPLLDAVLKTQVAALEEAVKSASATKFQQSYDETLAACNSCHAEAGYKFIHIVRPTAPPVTNQQWELDAKAKQP